jgi:hypothetical protein
VQEEADRLLGEPFPGQVQDGIVPAGPQGPPERPVGHDVIRDTPPEQPIAAYTANEPACLSPDKHVRSSPEANSSWASVKMTQRPFSKEVH